MNALRKIAGKYLSKALLATAMLGGFAVFGAANASARPVYVVPAPRAAIVVHGYWGPRPMYVSPYYAVRPAPVPYRYWDARYHCWRYR